MNITVVGAGATGGYFGARLAESGLNVTFLVRQNRATQLKTNGLVVKSVSGDIEIKVPQIALNSTEIPQCDLVLLALKTYQIEASLPHLRDLVNRGAKILPISNGIEHYELLINEFGEENVLGGNCKTNSTLDSEGTIHHTSKLHKLIFGELVPSNVDFCNRLQQAMSKANLDITYSQNIWVEIWIKYAYIAVFAGVTTAGNLTTDQMYYNDATKKTFHRALEEMTNLASAYGVILPDNYVLSNVEYLAKYPKGTTSSMHQDLRKGLPLEVESLQGAAIRLAQKINLEIPTVETLYGLIKPYEHGNAS